MRPSGELDVKNRAAARRVLKGRLAIEPVDDLLHNAEAKAGATLLPCIGTVGLREFLEDAGLEFVWNTRAMVSHRNTDGLGSRLDSDEHFFTGRRELDGVREEIGDDLHELVWVRENVDGCWTLDRAAHARRSPRQIRG